MCFQDGTRGYGAIAWLWLQVRAHFSYFCLFMLTATNVTSLLNGCTILQSWYLVIRNNCFGTCSRSCPLLKVSSNESAYCLSHLHSTIWLVASNRRIICITFYFCRYCLWLCKMHHLVLITREIRNFPRWACKTNIGL